MSVDIICPLYNAENYVENLQNAIEMQNTYEDVKNIRYIITKGNDNTEELVSKISKYNNKVVFKIIEPKEFSHSLTREKEAFKCESDILVFITQDIFIEKCDWLNNLVRPIINNEADATYSRQICNDKKTIEYYTRKKNYPLESKIKTKNDIQTLGINTFFYSDASSAIKRDVFIKINGYDGKRLPTNEDMYIAHKLITNGYKIKYCADSQVVHSHRFTLKETFKRYKLYGQFLKQESQINIKSTEAGSSLAKFIIINSLKDKNIYVLIKFVPDMLARVLGMKVGNEK
jgi:rhamnosyltransferase